MITRWLLRRNKYATKILFFFPCLSHRIVTLAQIRRQTEMLVREPLSQNVDEQQRAQKREITVGKFCSKSHFFSVAPNRSRSFLLLKLFFLFTRENFHKRKKKKIADIMKQPA